MPNTPAKPREVNPDLVRVTAMLCVLGVHFYTHCGIYNAEYTGVVAFFSQVLRTSFTPALALFLMLTGYFQRGKKLSARYYLGILRLLEMYVIVAAAEALYRRFYLGEALTARSFIGSLVNFTASEYSWYILLYGGLFLFIPFLNVLYSSLETRGHKRILILSVTLLSCLPFSALNVFVNLVPYWWQRIWPIAFYFMGAYMGEYRPAPGVKKCTAWFAAALLVFSTFNFFVYSPASPVTVHYVAATLYSHEGLQNAVLSPLLFLLVMNLRLDGAPGWFKRGAATVSKYAYGAFLFSSMTDSFVYGILTGLVPTVETRMLFLPVALPISLALSVLAAALADKLVSLIDRAVRPVAEKAAEWAYGKLMTE